MLDVWRKEVGVDILPQTKVFAGEVGDILWAGINFYRFTPTRALTSHSPPLREGSEETDDR
jgi:hypothetical protein